MPSDRAAAALIAAALSYTLDVGTASEQQSQRDLLDAASLYRKRSSDGFARCTFCGNEVRPHTTGSYRKVEGWAELRQKGGTHALVDQRATGEVACGECMTKRRLGIADEQPSLLDG